MFFCSELCTVLFLWTFLTVQWSRKLLFGVEENWKKELEEGEEKHGRRNGNATDDLMSLLCCYWTMYTYFVVPHPVIGYHWPQWLCKSIFYRMNRRFFFFFLEYFWSTIPDGSAVYLLLYFCGYVEINLNEGRSKQGKEKWCAWLLKSFLPIFLIEELPKFKKKKNAEFLLQFFFFFSFWTTIYTVHFSAVINCWRLVDTSSKYILVSR